MITDLAGVLTAYDATVLLIGEYAEDEVSRLPEFAVADGIIEFARRGNAKRDDRFLRVLKLRGSTYAQGLHSFTISREGLRVFPRLVTPSTPERYEVVGERVPTGVTGLDGLLDGGLWRGNTALIAGVAGSGKTTLGLQFLLEGARLGEKGLFFNFQENPVQLGRTLSALGVSQEEARSQGVSLRYASPVELSIDSIVVELLDAVEERGRHDRARHRHEGRSSAHPARGQGARDRARHADPRAEDRTFGRFGGRADRARVMPGVANRGDRGLAEISRALTYAASQPEVLELTLEYAADLMGASTALVMLGASDGLLRITACRGVAPEGAEQFPEPLDEKPLDRLGELLDGDARDRSVGVPLIVRGQVIGILGVCIEPDGTPDDDAEWLLSALGDQVAVALEGVRQHELRKELEGRVGELERQPSAKVGALDILSHDLRSPLNAIKGYVSLLNSEFWVRSASASARRYDGSTA